MKRIFSITLLILLCFNASAQDYKYAWLTDIHIGAPGAANDLNTIIKDINNRADISFIVVTGDITEKGKTEELEQCKKLLDLLKQPYYIIPGNHDLKWSENGGTKFLELWEDDRFIFNEGSDWHAGINSGIILRGGGGHLAPEDIEWLKDTLQKATPGRLFLYVHHPLDEEMDNWFKLINIIRDFNPVMVFAGHGHEYKRFNVSGIPSIMGRATLNKQNNPGYNLVQILNDSLYVSEMIPGISQNIIYSLKLQIPQINNIDSLQLINYSSIEVKQKDFRTTISAPLYSADGRIFISTYKNGIICTDFEGNELWDYDAGGTIVSRPAFYDGILVSATAEGDLIGLEAHTGKLIQVIGIGESITSQLEIIDLKYENEQTKGVLVGTGNGNLYCYDLYTFELIWENSSAKGMVETKPLFVNGAIIFGSWDGYLYSLSASSGVLNWKWSENKNFYYSPAAVFPVSDGKNVYIVTPDKYVSAVDLLLGTTVWRKNAYNGWETLQLSNNKEQLYIKSFENYFYILNAKDGSLIKKLEINFGIDTTPSPPAETNTLVFFGSKNGIIYSINKKDFTWNQDLFLGTARIHSIINLGNNKIGAINMDGKLAIITY